jgi:hypothetical protein
MPLIVHSFSRSQGPTPSLQKFVPPAIVKTFADLIPAADVRDGTIAPESLQHRRHLGLWIDLSPFHVHPLRHYTPLTQCLSLKGSSIPPFHVHPLRHYTPLTQCLSLKGSSIELVKIILESHPALFLYINVLLTS